jgi:cytochrome c-type biogenesis protein CcmF
MGGAAALWLASIASGLAVVVGAVGCARRDRTLSLLAAGLLTGSTLASTWALVRLGQAFLDQDYSNAYVARYSRRESSDAYRLAGIWGGMNGSLLLWTVLTGWVATVAAWVLPGAQRRRVLRVVVFGAVLCCYLVTNLAWANPFDTLALPPVRGSGLVPILEHPAMLYHPPLLYLGLVATIVAFADSVADGFTGAGPAEVRAAGRARRRAHLVAWTLLVVGMATGANWAYAELGWGGYWAWDPVENTAMLPWLVITLALHLGRSTRLSPLTRVGLGMLPYLVASAGTLLTRSGAAVSVHAFGQTPAIGRALLVVTLALLGVAVVGLVGARALALPPVAAHGPGPRQLSLRLSAALFGLAAVAVAAGTAWPLVAAQDQAIEGSFFSQIVGPLTAVGLLAVAVGPALNDSDDTSAAFPQLVAAAAGFVLGLVAALWAGWPLSPGGVLLGCAGAAAVGVLSATVRGRSATPIGVHIAHFGFAMVLVAVAGTTAGDTAENTLGEGESMSVGGYDVTLRDVELRFDDTAQPAERVVAVLDISRNGEAVATLQPSRDVYTDRVEVLAETSLRSTPRDDVQAVLKRAGDGRALVEVRVKPLGFWLWWGAATMALGGALTAIRPKPRSLYPTFKVDLQG